MRHEFHHRIQFLDGVLRFSETSSNGVVKVLTEIDIRDHQTDLAAQIQKLAIPDEQKLLVSVMASDPEALLRFGCDLTVTGWVNMPDPPDEFVEAPDPDPAGGITLRVSGDIGVATDSVPEQVASGQRVVAPV